MIGGMGEGVKAGEGVGEEELHVPPLGCVNITCSALHKPAFTVVVQTPATVSAEHRDT